MENGTEDDIAFTYIDEVNKQKYFFSKNILVNHLQNQCVEVNTSFDKIYQDDLKHLSINLCSVHYKYFVGYKNAQGTNNGLQMTCGDLLGNSANTILAATQALRCGFRLQSGILIRSVIEMCATIVDLSTQTGSLDEFLTNRYKSTEAISRANKIIPLFGRAWGLLSKYQIHINTNHAGYYSTGEYIDKSEVPANVTLGMIGVATLILEITTELAFIHTLENAKYWKITESNKCQFIPPSDINYDWTTGLLKDA